MWYTDKCFDLDYDSRVLNFVTAVVLIYKYKYTYRGYVWDFDWNKSYKPGGRGYVWEFDGNES